MTGRPGRTLGRATLLALLVGLAPPFAAPALATPERLVSERADSFTVAGDTVFWKTDCGSDLDPLLSRLRSVAATGGAQHTHYDPGVCRGDRVSGANVAVDADFVYWLSGDRRVVRLPRAAASGTPASVSAAGSAVNSSCCPIGVSAADVIWAEGPTVFRAPKTGGQPTPYGAPVGPGDVRDLQVLDDGSVTYMVGARLQRILPDTFGTTQILAGDVRAYASDGTRIYFSEVPATGDGQISSLRLSDGADRRLHATFPRTVSVDALAVDAVNLLWHEARNITGGPIMRQPLAGGSAVAITEYLTMQPRLVSNGEYLFWADGEGIWRKVVRSSVAPLPGDVRVTGVEVTQAIQTDDNAIPLVGAKPTAVRVYVRSREDAGGVWRVGARLTGSDGSRPLVPANASTIIASPGGSDRRTLTDSFLFLLEPGQTTPGNHSFRVQLFPVPGDRPQSDTTNDSQTVTVSFGAPIHRTLHLITYDHVEGGRVVAARPTAAQIEAHRQMFTNMHPLSSVTFMPLPGVSTVSFTDVGETSAFVIAHNWMKEAMSELWPSGGHDGAVLGPEDSAAGWCCTNEAGNSVFRASNQLGAPGETMGHEYGHRMIGNYHSYGDLGWPYARAPRDENGSRQASIGRNVGLRIAPTPQTKPGLDTSGNIMTWDMMSDPSPLWPSPNTYCRMLDAYRGSAQCDDTVRQAQTASARRAQAASARAAAVEQAPSGVRGGARRYLRASGVVEPKGRVRLDPFTLVPDPENERTPRGGTRYSITLTGAQGRVLSLRRFRLAKAAHDHRTPAAVAFSAYVRWDPRAERVVLRRGQRVIGQRAVSRRAPRVRMLTKLGRKPLTGPRTVRWTGSDPDGDRLSYSLQLSRDGGKHWIPLTHGLRRRTTTVDFGAVPGATRARLRVTATDGVRVASATSGLFGVARGAPRVQISPLAPAGKPATLRSGQPLVVTGQAFDSESGALTAAGALRWSSDRDGGLGSGPWIAARLKTAGLHRITLEARDADGRTARATAEVLVTADTWAGDGP